jgi:glycosyltransferase involved in cell wall biosynthesis
MATFHNPANSAESLQNAAMISNALPQRRVASRRTLSVIIPVYNEARSIELVIKRVRATLLAAEIIVVDDGSTDDNLKRLRRLRSTPEVELIQHPRNRGKGAAIRTGLEHSTGQYVIIQDADLEYDPADYPRLLEPLIAGKSNVVYGARTDDSPRRGPLLFRCEAAHPGYKPALRLPYPRRGDRLQGVSAEPAKADRMPLPRGALPRRPK